jgi:CHAT domain-containing protein/thioredoxin-like negative regulator of GroEL
MKSGKSEYSRRGEGCLSADELCLFVARPPGEDGGRASEIESHLARCPQCREELADIIKLLHPEEGDAGEEAPPLTSPEIQRTIARIREVGEQEKLQSMLRRRARRRLTAAVALVLIACGVAAFRFYFQRRPNQYFFAAKASLESFYDGRSPGGLRLDLPFQSAVTSRASPGTDAQRDAETRFSQALVNHEDVPEIRLGLAAALLARSDFGKAREQFDRVLNLQKNHFQALLGRAVTYYESARQAEDPNERRKLLDSGLADVDSALALRPESPEALYDRIHLLAEAGRAREALEEIDRYLSRDPDSRWAGRLKDLRVRMTSFKQQALQREVNRAARARDREALQRLAAAVPAQAFLGLRWALNTGLQRENEKAAAGKADATDLRWAAGILAEAGESNGDPSGKAILVFFDSLSPPQRRLKKQLDARLDSLRAKQSTLPLARMLADSATLEREFAGLNDVWQLVYIHHLRGNACLYQADFPRAEREYLAMRRYAETTGAPELRARALAALVSAYAHQKVRLADEQAAIESIRNLSGIHHLEQWDAFAHQASALICLRLSRHQDALMEFSAALGFAYRTQDESLLENLFENLIPIMDKLGRTRDADSFSAEAIRTMSAFEREADPDSAREVLNTRLNLYCRIGSYSYEAGSLGRAEALFREALAGIPSGSMKELQCRIKIGLAQTMIGKKKYSEAGDLLDDCLRAATEGEYAELAWQASYLQGKRARESGDAGGARRALLRSVDIIESMRGRIVAPELRQKFLTGRFDPFRDLVSLYYRELNDPGQARATVARAKSMTLLEYLKGSSTAAYPPAAEETNPRTLAIDYFFVADKLLGVVSGAGIDRIVELNFPRADAERQVQSFVTIIRNGNETDFTSHSRRLHDVLIAPLIAAAGNGQQDRLLIFPDGPLHLLPFGGLMDGRGRFLVQQYAISYAPSRNVLRYCVSLNRGRIVAGSRSVLLIDGSANLKGASDEIAGLSRIYGSSAHLMPAQDMARAATLAATAEIIHFAGHASIINGQPVLLLDSGLPPRCLGAGEIQSWRLRSNRLVTLAACSTAIGPQAEGDIPWGLVPAFLNAGAPALIVSLLPVDDPATAFLTSSLHAVLAEGAVSKSEALRKAQLALLDKARAAGRLNPASWIPYVLIGDPR